MAKHAVQRTSAGQYQVVDDNGEVLHTFPSEGEANLQVLHLDAEAQKAEDAEDGAGPTSSGPAATAGGGKPPGAGEKPAAGKPTRR
jgi:hypothetical protein